MKENSKLPSVTKGVKIIYILLFTFLIILTFLSLFILAKLLIYFIPIPTFIIYSFVFVHTVFSTTYTYAKFHKLYLLHIQWATKIDEKISIEVESFSKSSIDPSLKSLEEFKKELRAKCFEENKKEVEQSSKKILEENKLTFKKDKVLRYILEVIVTSLIVLTQTIPLISYPLLLAIIVIFWYFKLNKYFPK